MTNPVRTIVAARNPQFPSHQQIMACEGITHATDPGSSVVPMR
jgi:hypothetical protein